MDEVFELWECENCGSRRINIGESERWKAGDGVWLHACENMKRGLLSRTFRPDLTPVEQALLAMVSGMRAWAADEDGIHDAAWDAYVAAHKALGLPEPKEER